jgi:zinc protease
MTAPRIDPVAVEQYLDDELPYAADPGLDARYAEAFAYRRARYDDPRFLLPTVESLASVDAAGVEQVARQRFGDASDWSFSLSGDLAVDDAVQLARTYLGTLPGDGAVEDPGFVEPAPPVGVIQETVEGGTGERAGIAFHFSRRAEPSRKDRILAAYVGEVVTIRLTDVIRERLGESYSAFADVQTTGGPAPYADAYVSVTAGAETAASVSAAVLGELASLAEDGPTEAEYQAAREAIVRQGALFDNGEINDEVLDVLVDPAVERLDTYLLDGLIADSITSDEVRDAVGRWMPLDQYIEIRTVPR